MIYSETPPEQISQKGYVGVLFVVGAVACGYVAAKLWTGRETTGVWLLGTAAAACMFIGFVLSRTVGLPGFREAEWEVSGLLSLVVEGVFIVIAAIAARRRPAAVVVGAGEFMAYDALTPRGTSDHSVR